MEDEELGFVRISPKFRPNEKIVIVDKNDFAYETKCLNEFQEDELP